MIELQKLLNRLNQIAPLSIAEEWDNVGLLVGDPAGEVKRVMTCLTVTADAVAEAISKKADCIIAHHPIPFKPISRITTSTSTGNYLWQLASSRIAVYSPHTAWDNSWQGINQQLANMFRLEDIRPMVPLSEEIARKLLSTYKETEIRQIGTGRIGKSTELNCISKVIDHLQTAIHGVSLQRNAPASTKVNRIAFVCGSGGSFAGAAKRAGADLLITGEATYHQFLEATSLGLSLLTIGHYQSEAFAMSTLSDLLKESFPSIDVWRSLSEKDAYCDEI